MYIQFKRGLITYYKCLYPTGLKLIVQGMTARKFKKGKLISLTTFVKLK